MRVVFMGTPSFAVPSLSALASRHDVAAVYTRPDKPSGRGRTPSPPPVKAVAEEIGIPVFQPPSLRDPAEAALLASLHPDVVCVAAYGLLLPDAILEVPPLGCVNVHASLLPLFRGAAPIQRAILAGAETTGVTIMRMVAELDAGPYAAQVPVPMGEADDASLTDILAEVGAQALLAVLDEIERGTVVWVAQDHELATFAPKVTAEDVALDPSLDAVTALRRVRASSSSAPSRAAIRGRRAVVLKVSPSPASVPAGHVAVTREELLLGFTEGALRVDLLKPEGRAEMDGASFARGARLDADARWERWS